MFLSPAFKAEFLEATRETYLSAKHRTNNEDQQMRALAAEIFMRQERQFHEALASLKHTVNSLNASSETFGLIIHLQDIYKLIDKNIDPFFKIPTTEKTMGSMRKEGEIVEDMASMLNTVNSIMVKLSENKDIFEEVAIADTLIAKFTAAQRTANLRKVGVALMAFTLVAITAVLVVTNFILPALLGLGFFVVGSLLSIPTAYAFPVMASMSKSYGYGSMANKVGLFTKNAVLLSASQEMEPNRPQLEIEDELVHSDYEYDIDPNGFRIA